MSAAVVLERNVASDLSKRRRVVVALGLSWLDEGKLRAAEAQARALDATIDLLHVLPASPEAGAEPRARAYLGMLASRLRAAGLEARPVLRRGPVAEAIVAELAREGAELAILGSNVRRTLVRPALGGITEKVVRGTSRPVLLVRPPAAPDVPPEAGLPAA